MNVQDTNNQYIVQDTNNQSDRTWRRLFRKGTITTVTIIVAAIVMVVTIIIIIAVSS